jgi:hypothetical protein
MSPAATTTLLQTSGGWGVAAFCICGIVVLFGAIAVLWRRSCKIEDLLAATVKAHYQWATVEVAHRGDMLKRNADALEAQADMIRYLIPGARG